jgi:hypothetical protein
MYTSELFVVEIYRTPNENGRYVITLHRTDTDTICVKSYTLDVLKETSVLSILEGMIDDIYYKRI